MTNLWKAVTGPSAGVVQQHFVKARLEDLRRRNPDLEKKVEKILSEHPLLASLKLGKSGKWTEAYSTINSNLKAAELTINLNPESWFSTENKYETYAQTYERGDTAADGRNNWTLGGQAAPGYAREAGVVGRPDVVGALQ